MKPIDLDALKNRIHGPERPEINDGIQEVFWVEKCMNEAPALSPDDLRPVAEWIVKQTATGKEYTVCSRCGIIFQYKTDAGTLENIDMRGAAYCPACGAKMGKHHEV